MQIVYVILIGLILAEIIKLLEPTGILFAWIFQHISSIGASSLNKKQPAGKKNKNRTNVVIKFLHIKV